MFSVGEDWTAVVWGHPDEHKESYRYRVTWTGSENSSSVRTQNNTFRIPNLVPGTLYYFAVATETFDGTQSDSQWISNCTGLVTVRDHHIISSHIIIV